jgi:microsomal dipeptidase-like Zn-dependent dipeptidase
MPATLIDGLQYCNWSEEIFREIRAARLAALHVTICYHENFRETVANIEAWNRRFEQFPDLIFHGRTAEDVRRAQDEGRCAIFFGAQNPSCIEDDLGLVEVLHTLGLRFMQLSYNNQSLLASGCYEREDTGLTRMGREVAREMNRVGLVIDMSHSGERSTLEAIEYSQRHIAITHANPASWHKVPRNKSDTVLKELARSGGILGLSLYPHHLKNGSNCLLKSFCDMVARTVELMGIDHVGIGSDLCQDQLDSVVHWMRHGRRTKQTVSNDPGFPPQPPWFQRNGDHANIAEGLKTVGFGDVEIAKVMGGNWLRFFETGFGSNPSSRSAPNLLNPKHGAKHDSTN